MFIPLQVQLIFTSLSCGKKRASDSLDGASHHLWSYRQSRGNLPSSQRENWSIGGQQMELLITACSIDRMSRNLDFQTRIKVDVTTMSCCLYVRRDLQDRLDSHSRPSFGCGSLMGGSAFCLLDAPVIIPFILFKILKYVYKFFTIFNLKGVFPW